MSEEGGEGPVLEAVPRQAVGNVIAACRASWAKVCSTQATMEGLDEEAFAVYSEAAADELEGLGYVVEECDKKKEKET
jgi:hypothetical protein